LTKEREAEIAKAKAVADEMVRSGRELRPRDAGVRYTVVKQADSSFYEVRRADGKTDTRYGGSWDAEQIARMFEPVLVVLGPTLEEDLARFNGR